MKLMRPMARFSQGKNYYELLGVKQNASLEQIQAAYNDLASK